MKLRGGKFLGSGTYGCVFFPRIPCSKKTSTEEGVGKILRDVNEYRDELSIGKKIRPLDENGDVFNKLVKGCTVSLHDILADDEWNKCEHVDKTVKEYMQIIYKEKGIDLSKYLTNNFQNYDTTDIHILKQIQNLLKGVHVLVKAGRVHLDLKKDNVLISNAGQPNEKLLLFDFGLSRKFEDVYDYDQSDFLLEYSYPVYPPEFKTYVIMNSLVENLSGSYIEGQPPTIPTTPNADYYENFAYFLEDQFENGPLDGYPMYETLRHRRYLNKEYSTFVKTLVKEMKKNKFTHKSFPIETYFTQQFASKTDVFAAGTIIHGYWKKSRNPDENDPLKELSEKMTELNPYKRLTIEEAQKEFQAILNKYIKNTPQKNTPNSTPTPKKTSKSAETVIIVSSTSKSNKPISVYTTSNTSKKSSKKVITISSTSTTSTSSNTSTNKSSVQNPVAFNKCMTLKLKTLKEKVKENNLPKKLNALNKRELCKSISHLFEDAQLNTKTRRINKCMGKKLSDLKQIVDDKNLPKKLKQLKKADLCKALSEYTDNSNYSTAKS